MSDVERLAVHDLKLLRALVVVAREGNVTRAADILNLSQPAVSFQLRKLGQLSGLVLFKRTATGLELTKDGALLATKAEQVLGSVQDFNRLLQTMRTHLQGTLRVGTIIDPEFTRLGAFLQQMLQVGPGVSTSLRHGISGEVLDYLRNDTLDVGFYLGDLDQPADAEQFHVRHLSTLTYCVVAPPALLGSAKDYDWRELAALPWIGTPPASVHNRLLAKVFDRMGLRQNQVAQVDQESSMLAMVRTGVGLSLARESIALREAQSGNVTILTGKRLDTSLSFLCLAQRRDDPVVQLAFEAIDDVWPT